MARAAETGAPLLALRLRRYAAQEGLSWEELARSLDGAAEGLDQVALCRPPRPEQFAADVAAIAAHYVDARRLLELLRRIEVLEAFATLPVSAAADLDTDVPGLLLAARAREEGQESAPRCAHPQVVTAPTPASDPEVDPGGA